MNSRLLGTTEHLWYRLGELDSNNFVMLAKIEGTIDLESLKQALNKVIEAQVILRSRISSKGKSKYLQVEKFFDAQVEVIDRCGDEHWIELTEKEMNKSIPVDSFPLWRFTWLKGEGIHEFLMTFNHAISDGRSGLRFFESFLKLLDKPECEIPVNSLFPAYEKQLNKTDSFFKSSFKFFKAIKEYRANTRKKWFSFETSNKTESYTKLISKSIESQTLNKILLRCRESGSTVSTFVAAAMTNALGINKESIGLSLAVDVRPYLKGNHSHDIGYFVSTVDLEKEAGCQRDSLELSALYKEKLKENLNKSQFKFDTMMRWLALKTTKTKESFEKLIDESVNNCMLLTNLGKAGLKSNYDQFTLKHCFHVPAVHLVNRPFICLATSTFNDQMIFNFTYNEGLFEEDYISRLIERIMEAVTKL